MIFDGKKNITNETELVEVFNNHYINIVENRLVKSHQISHVMIILNTKGLLYK